MFAATVAIDNIPLHKHNPVKWEVLKMLNYIAWVTVSFYTLLVANNTELYTSMFCVVHSITLNYLYEMVFHTPDEAHVIHHCVCLFLQGLWVWVYRSNSPFVDIITIIGHMNNAAMFSSIFSSVRHITKVTMSRSCYEASTSFYKITYVVAKVFSGLCQYKVLLDVIILTPFNYPLADTAFVMCLITLLVLHSIQGYFVSKIMY